MAIEACSLVVSTSGLSTDGNGAGDSAARTDVATPLADAPIGFSEDFEGAGTLK